MGGGAYGGRASLLSGGQHGWLWLVSFKAIAGKSAKPPSRPPQGEATERAKMTVRAGRIVATACDQVSA